MTTPRTLQDLAKDMASIDFSMLMTHTDGGQIAGRPMSNNGDVDYDGDSYFFAWDDARTVADIERDAQVTLAMQGKPGIFGKPPLMLAIEGQAEIVRDRGAFAAHWQEELDRWFKQGPETPGLVMIKVHATRIHYWDGEDEGELTL
ncbi:pyridoxamine 5'-phosphate oxidase family protein [Variovorax sp. J22P168]|uniref:pyridoxamine 5'-phosphate oxidase family protein n=1 Tax=Variovorax jilinensis TaxID=3053513 RepID=UPI0025775DEA|nr:pyridoxamine 5'-phosphate oxidase family protein [Variovorax sp. J22P168]MDM0015499.1 pyridoxamine 5'-phosphate oxidase family protein [Variovorax sp. J22P168]